MNYCQVSNVFDKCKLSCCASVYFLTTLKVSKDGRSLEIKECVGFVTNGYYQI
jgi:hypothetical protein